jgi:hypothetical protein
MESRWPNLNAVTRRGRARTCSVEGVRPLLDAGADPNRTNRETRRQRRSWRARNDFRLDDIAEREYTPGDRLPNTPQHLTAPGPARACPSRALLPLTRACRR